jgi:hypothetical protein
MPAPQAIKDALLRCLDAAYDSDGTSIEIVTVVGNPMLSYNDPTVIEVDPQHDYKVRVDATGARRIAIDIKPKGMPIVWPD